MYSHVNLAEQADALNALADLGGKQATEKTDDEEASDFAVESVGTYVGSCAAFSGGDGQRGAEDAPSPPSRKPSDHRQLDSDRQRQARIGRILKMEQETGLEPATTTLAMRLRRSHESC